ncbi:MAG: energy transducer TonB, partial [Bacteroidales bacterium]|nr:energy transducer TonB [Bacteroidales bacterium]
TETAQPEAVAEQIMATTVDSAGNKTTQMVDPVKEFADARADSDEVFTVVQEMPEYPGGTEAMMKFLADNIKYPAQAIRDSIQGRVYINFIVEKNGRISSAKVLRGIGGGCDEEAVRVVELMPSWIPGKQRGENVRVSFNIPIKFTLE